MTIVVLLPVTLAVVYYIFLALVSLKKKDRAVNNGDSLKTRFAVVIPAHNEEESIERTIRSCQALDYPKDLYDIYVIADNCTDQTAEIAREIGAKVLERFDQDRRGKGFALEWAFSQLLTQNYDAMLVIDADCSIDSHALKVFDLYFANGAQVLQANDVTSNPDDSPMNYALAVGNLTENDLFYAPKSRLGLSVFLRGTGMVFKAEILQKFPWKAYSIVEDVDYSLNLLEQGIRIYFVPEVKVASEFPVNQKQLQVQRNRWAQGNLKFGKTHALRMLIKGLLKGNLRLADGGWTLLVLSRPLVLLGALAGLLLALFNYWLNPVVASRSLIVWSLVLLLFLGVYFFSGIALLGINSRRLKFLMQAPLLVIHLVRIAVGGLMGNLQNRWARTPR
ncbi:MAG: glycosyltransferase family 2 protein [Candidatus Helarchaeota archaeon]